MNKCRLLACISTLCCMFALMLPVQAYAQESGSTTTIKTTVPDTHTVLLDIGEHGSVIINGTAFTHEDKQVEIARLSEQSYIIQPDNGWQTGRVLYGQEGAQEQETLLNDAFTAPAVNSNDNKLTVTFEKKSTGSGTDTENTGKPDKNSLNGTGAQAGTNVKTGDTTNLFAWGMTAVLSVFGIAVAGLKRRKSEKETD